MLANYLGISTYCRWHASQHGVANSDSPIAPGRFLELNPCVFNMLPVVRKTDITGPSSPLYCQKTPSPCGRSLQESPQPSGRVSPKLLMVSLQ